MMKLKTKIKKVAKKKKATTKTAFKRKERVTLTRKQNDYKGLRKAKI